MPGSKFNAAEFISSIVSSNKADIAIKGIGKIKVWDSEGMQTSRAAWIGVTDGRLRLEMLGLPGHPVAKFIYDGNDYIFVSPLDQQSFRRSGADSNLKPLTGISVPSADVMLYLSGSIPLCEYDEGMFQDGDPNCRNVLILKRKWHGVVEKLFLNHAHDGVEKVEMYRWGMLVYSAELGHTQTVDNHELPFHLTFSNGNQNGFSIEVERCWLDIAVNPDMFSIEPTSEDKSY